MSGEFCTLLRSLSCSHTPKYAVYSAPCNAQNSLAHKQFLGLWDRKKKIVFRFPLSAFRFGVGG